MDRDPPKTFPGLIDAHVHIKSPGGLAALAAAGIIAVRDAGMRGNAAVGREIPRLPGTQPVVVSAGWALYKKGGYGSLFGVPVDGRGEITAEIRRLAESGAGIIKVMASGLVSLREPGKITAGGFSGDELAVIVDEAARRGFGVMAHANGEEAIIACAEAGVRSVEHGFFMTARALEAMAKHGTFWTPTVRALERAAERSAASAEARTLVAGLIRSHQKMILHAHNLDVSLAVGTDCVLPDARHTEAYEAELMYFEQTGLSRNEVLAIASDSGAKLLGI